MIRGVFSPFAHPLFTAFTGIGIGHRGRQPQAGGAVSSRRCSGTPVAVGAHAAWNGSMLLGGGERLRASPTCS